MRAIKLSVLAEALLLSRRLGSQNEPQNSRCLESKRPSGKRDESRPAGSDDIMHGHFLRHDRMEPSDRWLQRAAIKGLTSMWKEQLCEIAHCRPSVSSCSRVPGSHHCAVTPATSIARGSLCRGHCMPVSIIWGDLDRRLGACTSFSPSLF